MVRVLAVDVVLLCLMLNTCNADEGEGWRPRPEFEALFFPLQNWTPWAETPAHRGHPGRPCMACPARPIRLPGLHHRVVEIMLGATLEVIVIELLLQFPRLYQFGDIKLQIPFRTRSRISPKRLPSPPSSGMAAFMSVVGLGVVCEALHHCRQQHVGTRDIRDPVVQVKQRLGRSHRGSRRVRLTSGPGAGSPRAGVSDGDRRYRVAGVNVLIRGRHRRNHSRLEPVPEHPGSESDEASVGSVVTFAGKNLRSNHSRHHKELAQNLPVSVFPSPEDVIRRSATPTLMTPQLSGAACSTPPQSSKCFAKTASTSLRQCQHFSIDTQPVVADTPDRVTTDIEDANRFTPFQHFIIADVADCKREGSTHQDEKDVETENPEQQAKMDDETAWWYGA